MDFTSPITVVFVVATIVVVAVLGMVVTGLRHKKAELEGTVNRLDGIIKCFVNQGRVDEVLQHHAQMIMAALNSATLRIPEDDNPQRKLEIALGRVTLYTESLKEMIETFNTSKNWAGYRFKVRDDWHSYLPPPPEVVEDSREATAS